MPLERLWALVRCLWWRVGGPDLGSKKSKILKFSGIAPNRSGMGLGSVWGGFGAILGIWRPFGSAWRSLEAVFVVWAPLGAGSGGLWRWAGGRILTQKIDFFGFFWDRPKSIRDAFGKCLGWFWSDSEPLLLIWECVAMLSICAKGLAQMWPVGTIVYIC